MNRGCGNERMVQSRKEMRDTVIEEEHDLEECLYKKDQSGYTREAWFGKKVRQRKRPGYEREARSRREIRDYRRGA